MSEKAKREQSRVSGRHGINVPPRAAFHGGRPSTYRGPQSPEIDSTSSITDQDGVAPTPAISLSLKSAGACTPYEDASSRIATLEIELARTEDEFSKELLRMGEKLSNESELLIYWQQKHSVLNREFLAVDGDLRVLRLEETVRRQKQEEKERDVVTRVSSLTLDRDTLKEAYHTNKARLWEAEQECDRLRIQLRSLKHFVSQSSRTASQVSDEVIANMIRALGNSLQNWIMVNYRRAHLNIDAANDQVKSNLLELVPNCKRLMGRTKIPLIQSIVSSILLKEIFENYFVGLPREQCTQLCSIEMYLSDLSHDDTSVNQWRSSTLTLIRSQNSETIRVTTSRMLLAMCQKLDDILVGITGEASISEQRMVVQQSIIMEAIELSRVMRVQKAKFSFIMPLPRPDQPVRYDPLTMEDVNGEDEDTLSEMEVQCVVFPGLIKDGGENGNHRKLKNVLAKARVLCFS